jgi:hypothetical protein
LEARKKGQRKLLLYDADQYKEGRDIAAQAVEFRPRRHRRPA